jgi:hypothetical protein
MGHKRHIEHAPVTSACHPTPEILLRRSGSALALRPALFATLVRLVAGVFGATEERREHFL